MKVFLFANTDWYLYNFRIPLMRALKNRGYEVVLSSPSGSYSDRLAKQGFRWIQFDFSRSGTNLFREVNILQKLIGLYRKENPDLFIHFTIKCVIYGSLAARLLGNKTVINSIDGLGYVFSNTTIGARILRLFVQPLYRFALRDTLVIFQNPDDREVFLKLKLVKEDQYTVIRGVGIEVNNYAPVKQVDDVPVILFAGRLLHSKGVEILINAARILKDSGVQARFVLVGRSDPGNPESIKEDMIQDWVKESIVEYWGWRDDMPQVFQKAHIFCLPTIHREGLPLSLMEAAASAMPIVASDVPGCRELVQNRENGFLVPPNDALALAATLRKLIENPKLRSRMGQCGREIVEQNFSAERIVSETLDRIDAFHKDRNRRAKG